MTSLLSSRPVLWFLFLFNAAVAVAVAVAGHHLHIHGQTLHGTQQIMTCAGMGAVSLGAGAALARRRRQPT
jgi:MYXO-CTERM domain-containing protein